MSEPRINLADLRDRAETDPGAFLYEGHDQQILALIDAVHAVHALITDPDITAAEAVTVLRNALAPFDFGVATTCES